MMPGKWYGKSKYSDIEFFIMQPQVFFSLLLLIIPARREKQGGALYSPIPTVSEEGNGAQRRLGMDLG